MFIPRVLTQFDPCIFQIAMLGSYPQSGTTEPMLVVSDSLLPTATPYDDTLLPCSPSQLLNTDVAASTLKSTVAHEESVEEKVWFEQSVMNCFCISLYIYIKIKKSLVPNLMYVRLICLHLGKPIPYEVDCLLRIKLFHVPSIEFPFHRRRMHVQRESRFQTMTRSLGGSSSV